MLLPIFVPLTKYYLQWVQCYDDLHRNFICRITGNAYEFFYLKRKTETAESMD